MHEQYPCDEAESLAVAHILVQQTVGLQQIVQGQLSWPQLCGEVRVSRECPSWKNKHTLSITRTHAKPFFIPFKLPYTFISFMVLGTVCRIITNKSLCACGTCTSIIPSVWGSSFTLTQVYQYIVLVLCQVFQQFVVWFGRSLVLNSWILKLVLLCQQPPDVTAMGFRNT